jgi:hypothetical protein
MERQRRRTLHTLVEFWLAVIIRAPHAGRDSRRTGILYGAEAPAGCLKTLLEVIGACAWW